MLSIAPDNEAHRNTWGRFFCINLGQDPLLYRAEALPCAACNPCLVCIYSLVVEPLKHDHRAVICLVPGQSVCVDKSE